MRILTVRQPWAWAIIHGGKDVENRVRNIAGGYRGPVAIHAAKTTLATFDSQHADLWPYNRAKHVLGAIIGVVELVDVHFGPFAEGWNPETERIQACSPWAERDVFHLELANPRPLAEPIPFRGALGLRTLDEATTAAVLTQIAPLILCPECRNGECAACIDETLNDADEWVPCGCPEHGETR